ncbi:alpha/beta fold hydrolase [Mucilaginibacter terrenus]|uniref:Alpha/beta fold hydrolase n=1 Tax=Mucilaginibacter terrenus TaxID=2482727 RepID=A0A3E2NVJ2_9SPHI|nr:alpha/beta fold hydrolase [Mucilaginibacter terrenus]RFZ85034.1 alpha/beta fold hydrolase [Mucilaginibacter terrenus]
MYTHDKEILMAGVKPADAKGALIMLHGRGSSAGNIVGLANNLNVDDMAIYAPQATNNSWYPYSFMAPDEDNQPALNSALEMVNKAVNTALADGIPQHKIYLLGFSQGACLTLEYLARHAQPFGGAVAFTGGLAGEKLNMDNYKGDFIGMPVLITTSNPDPHVPLTRVQDSVKVLKGLDAAVTLEVYNNKSHSISYEEIELANKIIFA